MSSDSLGDRMKGYEAVSCPLIVPRMPLILRLDGRAFHTYTQHLKRPWDDAFNGVMNETARVLCSDIQGAQIAYVQSDEISILVHAYKTLNSQPYFGGKLQKIISVPAAVAAATFTANSWQIFHESNIKPAYFDCRAFVLPESDVCNYFLWRQQDCTRNSLQMLARSLYSHKECNNRSSSELQEMCFQKGHNWDKLPTKYKRGRCIVKENYTVSNGTVESVRSRWVVDDEIPIFSQDREYINNLLATEET